MGLQAPPSPDLSPQELKFFRPPKGVNVISPLSEVPREYGTEIVNLILDRQIMRSRWGTEAYHANSSGKRIQATVDIRGSATNNVTITARSTAGLTNNGWTDPDGSPNNKNTVSGGPGITTVPEANRLYNVIGDPTVDTNVDAYDDQYNLAFDVTVDHGTVPNGWTVAAEVDVEYSTDGGTVWTNLGGGNSHNAQRSTAGTTTNSYTFAVAVPGSPTLVRFRLKLKLVVQGPSGTASGEVSASTAITWQTTSGVVSTPDRLPTRWTENKIQIYEDPTDVAAAWTDRYTFPASQLNTDNLLPSYVLWGDTFISTDIGDTPQGGGGAPIGSKGLVSTLLATPHTSSILTHSPRAAQLFVLGNRVCAVRTNEWTGGSDPWVTAFTNLSRVRWSVKDDSNDWDGLGSGWEDLRVAAGSVDEAMAGVAITDETAIVVSEKTVRRMDVTGFFDAPFRFTLFDEIPGTLSRYTIKAVPGGAVYLGYDDVLIVTLGDIKRVGSIALRDSIGLMTNPRLAVGYMDKYNSRYLVAFKEGATQVVWQYSFFDEGWTKIKLPFELVHMDLAFFNVASVPFYGAYFTQKLQDGYSVRENPTLSRDVNTSAVAVDSELEARTGFVNVRDALHEIQLVQIQLLYEAEEAQTLTLEYSVDGGDTWLPYGQIDVIPTVKPTIKRSVRPVLADAAQIRVRSTTLGQLRLISLHAFAMEGAMIAP